MKIAIGVPCMGSIRAETVGSLLQMQRSYPDVDFKWFITGNSLVYDARNEILNYAINEDADYLLYVDSDIMYPYTALGELLAQNKGIISGVYWTRSENVRERVIYSEIKPRPIFGRVGKRTAYMGQINGIFEVKGCGMGFCLIRKDVIHKITRQFVSPFEPYRGLGEDLSFCYRLGRIKEPIFAMEVGLEHIGTKHYKGV